MMGGLHVSSLPDEALEHCASVSSAKGRRCGRKFSMTSNAGNSSLATNNRRAARFDLRHAPMPRFDLLDPEKYNRITVQTSRGCPHRCEFCASSILLTPRYKLKPVEKVIAEIHAIKTIWSRPFIEFADDNSFVNTPHYEGIVARTRA